MLEKQVDKNDLNLHERFKMNSESIHSVQFPLTMRVHSQKFSIVPNTQLKVFRCWIVKHVTVVVVGKEVPRI